MRSVIGTVLMVSIGAGASFNTNAKSPTPSDEFYKDIVESVGPPGGVPVVEDPTTYNSGPIKGIRVCHGDRLDAITVTYGNREGKKIGRGPGACEDVDINPGQKINAVRVRSGDWIDAIQFQIDGKWGTRYGGGGGVEKTIRSPNGGSLAVIDGRHGAKIDQLTFSFGLPYTMKDIVYDTEAIANQTRIAPIENLGSQCFVNKTAVAQKASKTFKKDVTVKASWNFETSTQWGVEASISYSYAGFTGGLKTSFSQAQKASKGGEDSTTKSLSNDYQTLVPPGTIIQTNFVASEKSLRIPFTYTMAHYRNDDPKNIVNEQQFSGMFEGVAYTDDRVDWKPVDNCDGSSPIENLGSPEQQRANVPIQSPSQANSNTGPAEAPPAVTNEPVEDGQWDDHGSMVGEEEFSEEVMFEHEEVFEEEVFEEEVFEEEIFEDEVFIDDQL